MTRRVAVRSETRAPTGDTAAYLLDDAALLIDPADRAERLDRAVRETGIEHVAVTHHHPDHVGGVAEYAEAFDLTVWARAGRTDAFADATGLAPDRTYYPGESLPPDSGVAVLDAPGHAPEHVAFAASDGLVTGDLLVAEGSVVVGAPEGDMRAYLTALRRVLARRPERCYPAHGPVIDDPDAVCRRLLEHRLRRERAIVAAVRAGASTADEIVDRAYEKDVSAVRDLARATVVAHLDKLAVEGRIEWDGERAREA